MPRQTRPEQHLNLLQTLLNGLLNYFRKPTERRPLPATISKNVKEQEQYILAQIQALENEIDKLIKQDQATYTAAITAFLSPFACYSSAYVLAIPINTVTAAIDLVCGINLDKHLNVPIAAAVIYFGLKQTYDRTQLILQHRYPDGISNTQYAQVRSEINRLRQSFKGNPQRIKKQLEEVKKNFQRQNYRVLPFWFLILLILSNLMHELCFEVLGKNNLVITFWSLMRLAFLAGLLTPPIYAAFRYMYESYNNWNVEEVKTRVLDAFNEKLKLSSSQQNWQCYGSDFDTMAISINIPMDKVTLLSLNNAANLHDYYINLAHYCLKANMQSVLLTETTFCINLVDAYRLLQHPSVFILRNNFEAKIQAEQETRRREMQMLSGAEPDTGGKLLPPLRVKFHDTPPSAPPIVKPGRGTMFIPELNLNYDPNDKITETDLNVPIRLSRADLPAEIYWFIMIGESLFNINLANENKQAIINTINNATIISTGITQDKRGAVGIKFTNETYQPGAKGPKYISDIKVKFNNIRAFGREYVWWQNRYQPVVDLPQDAIARSRNRLFIIDGCDYGH